MYGPEIPSEEIAVILKTLAEIGNCLVEIFQGIICAQQKPGKRRGPLDHLQPITPSNMP